MDIWDKKYHEYIGTTSERELYKYYKNIDRVKDQN
jgi:hypothetical protein